MKKILYCLTCLLMLASCGESLFDTYKDYAGDGEIRFVGKVKELTASPGWQCIRLKWVNGTDPIIDQVEVKWTSEDVSDSVLLPAGTDNYQISNLVSGSNYEVSVMSVDKNMHQSVATTAYVRPYNADHEAVQAFTRLVSRNFFLHNHLLLTFIGWDANVKEAYLTYTAKSSGEQKRYDLTEEVVNKLHVDIPDVDATKPVQVHRSGYIEGCEDLINFDPIALDEEPVYNSEFKTEMKRMFGYDETIPEEWRTSTTSLDLDWSASDVADLLYLPNLKKLYLGRNRYVRADQVDDTEKGQSQLTDNDLSIWVLDRLHELNGLEVYRYDKHFSKLPSRSYIHDMGHHAEPQLNFVSMKGAKVSVMPAESDELISMGWKSHEEYLIDGKVSTSWMPYSQKSSTTYTITVELPKAYKVKGMRLVQSYYDEANAAQRALNPSQIRVYKSANGSYYPLATNLEDTNIGSSTGEVNYIPFADDSAVQFIRIELTTPMYFSYFQVSLAELGFYE